MFHHVAKGIVLFRICSCRCRFPSLMDFLYFLRFMFTMMKTIKIATVTIVVVANDGDMFSSSCGRGRRPFSFAAKDIRILHIIIIAILFRSTCSVGSEASIEMNVYHCVGNGAIATWTLYKLGGRRRRGLHPQTTHPFSSCVLSISFPAPSLTFAFSAFYRFLLVGRRPSSFLR